MGRAGFLDRIGEENVCAHIDAALARSREILGLPPAPTVDPLQLEKRKIEAARQELNSAMERINDVLNTPAAEFSAASDSRLLPELDKTDTVAAVKRSAKDVHDFIPKSGVPTLGAPGTAPARKEISREHAVLEAGTPEKAGK